MPSKLNLIIKHSPLAAYCIAKDQYASFDTTKLPASGKWATPTVRLSWPKPPITGAQCMVHKSGGPGNASLCPGHSQSCHVHEATLFGLHPHQPWSRATKILYLS